MRIKQAVRMDKAYKDRVYIGEANISRQMRWMMYMQSNGINNHQHAHVQIHGIGHT